MSRQVDLDFINTKMRHREALVNDGKFLEMAEQEGRTSDSMKKEAKNILGIEEDDLIVLEYESKLATQNKKIKAFVSLNNCILKGEETNMFTQDEIASLRDVEIRVAGVISKLCGIEMEDLYTNGGI